MYMDINISICSDKRIKSKKAQKNRKKVLTKALWRGIIVERSRETANESDETKRFRKAFEKKSKKELDKLNRL